MTLSLLRVAKACESQPHLSVGDVLDTLGERSFGWTVLVFAILNLLPLPLGATLITAIPLLIVTVQMARGRPRLTLPRRVMAISVSRPAFRRGIHRLRPIMRPLERILRPRLLGLFSPERERWLGGLMFLIALALFLPIPLSGWGPAISLLICAFGLIAFDGAVLLLGLAAGAVSIGLTLAVVFAIVFEASVLL